MQGLVNRSVSIRKIFDNKCSLYQQDVHFLSMKVKFLDTVTRYNLLNDVLHCFVRKFRPSVNDMI